MLNDSGNYLYFIAVNTYDGSIVFSYSNTSGTFKWNSDYCRIAIATDGKIYLTIEDSSSIGYIWVYSVGGM